MKSNLATAEQYLGLEQPDTDTQKAELLLSIARRVTAGEFSLLPALDTYHLKEVIKHRNVRRIESICVGGIWEQLSIPERIELANAGIIDPTEHIHLDWLDIPEYIQYCLSLSIQRALGRYIFVDVGERLKDIRLHLVPNEVEIRMAFVNGIKAKIIELLPDLSLDEDDIRVIGSVAKGLAQPGSDIDFMINTHWGIYDYDADGTVNWLKGELSSHFGTKVGIWLINFKQNPNISFSLA